MMPGTMTERADLAIAGFAEPARDSPMVAVFGPLSDIADQPQLVTLCAVTLAAGLVRRDTSLARTGGRMLAAALIATVLKSAVKHRVDRTRPRAVDDGQPYEMRRGASDDSDHSSFPSGHTSGAVAVARAIARDHPGYRLAAYGAAAAIAVVQIPRGKHYPTDLIAGAVVGVVAEGIAHAGERIAVRLARSRPTPMPSTHPRPAIAV